MNRSEYLERLERGLRQMPPVKRAEILDDYKSYFTDGAAAGRSEQEIAHSLGSPTRLAVELALGFEVESHAAAGGSRSVVRPLVALLGLVMMQGIMWLPLVGGVLLVLLLLGVGVVALVYSGFTLVTGPFEMPLGGIVAVLLRGLAYLAAGAGALAAARAGVLVLVKLFVRIHRRSHVWRPTTEVSR